MTQKRRRAPTSPIERANRKTDKEFIAEYLQPENKTSPSTWVTEWVHPKTDARYKLSLSTPTNLSEDEVQACFDLIEETSREDYENSAGKWNPEKKFKEMKSPELRYVIVKDNAKRIRGFTSFMPTYEEGEPVVYCYEIHLKPELHGTGLSSLLMSFHTTIAVNLPPITKVMLTCFLSNERALRFYQKLGYEKDPISPGPRTLRRGKILQPDYIIMSKKVRDPPEGEKPPTKAREGREAEKLLQSPPWF